MYLHNCLLNELSLRSVDLIQLGLLCSTIMVQPMVPYLHTYVHGMTTTPQALMYVYVCTYEDHCTWVLYSL